MLPLLALAAFNTVQQAEKDKRQRTLAAAQARVSPWTGQQIQNPGETQDVVGNFGSAYAGGVAQEQADLNNEAWRKYMTPYGKPAQEGEAQASQPVAAPVQPSIWNRAPMARRGNE